MTRCSPNLPAHEDNPFLGCRGIRFSLDQPEIFLIQLRAMLQANAGLGNLQLLFPMIATIGELDEALGLLARAERDLGAEGRAAQRPRVAVMIEVPAAVFLVGVTRLDLVVGPLGKQHDRKSFDCGVTFLNQYLDRYTGQDMRRRVNRVFIASPPDAPQQVIGYYSLSKCPSTVSRFDLHCLKQKGN